MSLSYVLARRSLYLTTRLVILLLPFSATAQDAPVLPDGNAYYASHGLSSPLVNGYSHYGYFPVKEGIPYWEEERWFGGTVCLMDEIFVDSFRYDLVEDVLVARHPRGFGVNLLSERVQYFTLENHRFLRLEKGLLPGMRVGFYEILDEGKLTLMVQRRKVRQDRTEGSELVSSYEPIYNYYIRKEGSYIPINNYRKLSEITGERKSLLKKQLKAAGIRPKKESERAMTFLVHLYNQKERS